MNSIKKTSTQPPLTVVKQGDDGLIDNKIKTKNGGHAQPPPQSEDGKAVSEAEYWAKYYNHPDFNYEWNNGILEEKPVSDYQNSRIAHWFLKILDEYLSVNPIADIIILEIGFRLALAHKVAIRKPDFALILKNNPIEIVDEDRTYKGTYDICIEILSDSNKKEVERDTVHKKQEYAQGGVKEYYILHHTNTHTTFYRLGPTGIYHPIQPTPDGIIQSSVLPGFQFREADLYRLPDLETLVDDEVYQHFVDLRYQAERQRAKQEQQRAEQEQQRAEQERQRADHLYNQQQQTQQTLNLSEARVAYLSNKLKEAGIDPDTL